MGDKLEAGALYRGPCGALRDSNWLTAETLPVDRDTIVTIEAVVRRTLVKFKDQEKKGYGSLRFAGRDKELGLNATHIRVLKALFGGDTTAWFGKRIALYIDPNVNAFGQIVSAVRIRAKPVPADAVSTTDPKLTTTPE